MMNTSDPESLHMKLLLERYFTDATFNHVVFSFYTYLQRGELTETDLHLALELAKYKLEMDEREKEIRDARGK